MERTILICCVVVPQKMYSMPEWFKSINELINYNGKAYISYNQRASIFECGNDSQMIKDYNDLKDICVKQGADVLFVDSDVILPKDAYKKLVDSGKYVIGGIVKHPKEYNVYKRGFGPASTSLPLERQDITPNTGIHECEAIGFGCILIRNSVLENIEFTNVYRGTAYSKGFDLVTCLRLKDMGYDIHAHSDVCPKHHRKVSGEWIDEPEDAA